MSSKNCSPNVEISVEELAKLCFDKFNLLPKTGKPNENEWTIMAGIILHNEKINESRVISLGCGTKCIGKSNLCSQGLIINDSHAEVMARRGFLRYIYYQLNKAATNNESIFMWLPEKHKFQLKDEFSFHFLSTQIPCGDACIIALNETEKCGNEPLSKRKKVWENDDINVGCTIGSVYTGAKLIGINLSDAMEQVVGAVRTKPGRGERTLSMSCSDKLARWQLMGVQGALLDFMLTKPIYFDTLNFWGKDNVATLRRAIWERFKINEYDHAKYRLHTAKIRIFNNPVFPHAQVSRKKPSPNGLVWCDIPNSLKPYEICVNGKKQGVTTIKLATPQSALRISKFFLFQEFIHVIKLKPDLLTQDATLEHKTYLECKFMATDYQNAWSEAKIHYFKQWSQKPENILKFYAR